MIKFIKGNIIFITNTLILVGLFVGVSNMKKVSDLNRVNNFQANTANIPVVTTPQAIPQITPVETASVTASEPTTPKKVVVAKKKVIKKVAIKKARTSIVKNRVRRNIDENDD